jgi:arylformamidase
MKAYDITGVIREGMWNYEPPFPPFRMRPLGNVPWAGCEVYCEVFEGLHSQTGTYLETPAHFFGNGNSYLAADIPVGKLVGMPCALLMIDPAGLASRPGRPPVTAELLERCPGSGAIRRGDAILVGTGWGRRWMERDYLSLSPWFTRDAMDWLLEKKPFLLGTDFPRWENMECPQGFFPDFYKANVLMLAPCVNLENVPGSRLRLTALPVNIPGTSSAPCRAVLTEEDG